MELDLEVWQGAQEPEGRGKDGAARGERYQPLAQSHTVAMKNQKTGIFNLANCFIYFVEVPLNTIIFLQLVLELPEQSHRVFVRQPTAQHHELCSFRSRSKYRY